MKGSLADRVAAGTPALHYGGERHWNALPGTLRMLEELTPEGGVTIETGAGASTVVFAGRSREHVAVTPNTAEHAAIRAFCDELGVDSGHVQFIGAPSDEALPNMPRDPSFDGAFIDGRHAFPTPVVDFAYLSRLLKVNGVLILDDVPIPSVRMVFDHCSTSPDWRIERFADNRAAAFIKVAEEATADLWRQQGVNDGWPNYSYLPLATRLALGTKARAKQTRRAIVGHLRERTKSS